jgi:hypothetical protein
MSKEQRAKRGKQASDPRAARATCTYVAAGRLLVARATRSVHSSTKYQVPILAAILLRENQKHYDHRPWQWPLITRRAGPLIARRSYFYFYVLCVHLRLAFFYFLTSLVTRAFCTLYVARKFLCGCIKCISICTQKRIYVGPSIFFCKSTRSISTKA